MRLKKLFAAQTGFRIPKSRRDLLSSARKAVDSQTYPEFDSTFVVKPWGFEYLLGENSRVGVWHLSIDAKQATSFHCHPNKNSILLVLNGLVRIYCFRGFFELAPGEFLQIEPGVHHRISASDGCAELLEIESPPNKHDLVRLQDYYGRVSSRLPFSNGSDEPSMWRQKSLLSLNGDFWSRAFEGEKSFNLSSHESGLRVEEVVVCFDQIKKISRATIGESKYGFVLDGELIVNDDGEAHSFGAGNLVRVQRKPSVSAERAAFLLW